MYTVICLNILAIFFAWLESDKHYKHGLKVSFFLIFIFLAFRYNYGNDYKNYFNGFYEINRYSIVDFFDKDLHYEPGWILLCRLFKPLGFFSMIIALAMFNCIIYYRFIKKYVPVKYYWLAVFFYVFNTSFMLVHLSAIRQSLAIAIFIFSLNYLHKKDAIRYFLCVAIAVSLHTSAIVLVPIFLLGLFNWRINVFWAAVILSLFVSIFIFGKSFLPNINYFISQYFERYEVYQDGDKLGTGLGMVFFSILLLFTIYYDNAKYKYTSTLFKIAIIGLLVIPFGLIIVMIARLGMYMQPVTIAVYPIILLRIKTSSIRFSFVSILMLFTVYTFYLFFQSEIWRDAYTTYQTIFSAPDTYWNNL